jgi:uncharacterized protein
MEFVWDERKRQENLRKHGLDFVDAPHVFRLPFYEKADQRIQYGEDRVVAVGFLLQRVVVLVYAERPQQNVNRIISLRKATKREREEFKQYLENRLG